MPHRKVLVAFLVRDGEKWLERFLNCVDRLDYLKEDLKYVALEGNSKDSSWQVLSDFAHKHQGVWLTKFDVDEAVSRYKRLAVLKNRVINEALTDEEFVLWLDSDLVDLPISLLRELIKANVDVVAPYVLVEDTDKFYDHLAFRKDGLKIMFPDGVPVCPLPADIFEVDSVGTCMLVNAGVYRKGVRYPESDAESEQVLFCEAAKKNGFRVFADPHLKVIHANLPKYGVPFH